MEAVIWAVIVFCIGLYLGWKAGSAATTEAFLQKDANRIQMELMAEQQRKKIETQVKYEASERDKAKKRIEKEERNKLK